MRLGLNHDNKHIIKVDLRLLLIAPYHPFLC